MAKQNKIAVLYSGGAGIAGIEKYLLDLFNNIEKNDFDLELLSLGEWELTKMFQKVSQKVKIFDAKRIRLKTVKEIGQYCKLNNIDLLVSQGVVSNAYARLVAKKYKIRNLVTVHSDMSKEYEKPIIRLTYSLIDKIMRKYTSHYITVSKYLKSILEKSGINNKKISVIYNGVNFEPAKKRAHKRLIIGSAGRLEYIKGFDILIRAFSQLENKRLRLKIAGVGSKKSELQDLASSLNIKNRLEFVYYKNDAIPFFDSIDVYVQPSRSEGFGLALVMAMSQNLPVVVTPTGAMPEIVTDDVTGYISKDMSPESLAVAISKAVENIDKSTKIGIEASKFVCDNFSLNKWIDNTENVYKKVIK